jgi:hypothetical protein
MRDIVEQTPSERDEAIYAQWESGKTLRVLACEFSTSVIEVERAIDRCLPVFNSATQMRSYKREIKKLEDLGSKYHAKAMRDDSSPEDAHIYARLNERYCAMQGWSSVNIRLDPYAAQVKEQPSRFEKIREAILRLTGGPLTKHEHDLVGGDGNGAAVPPADDVVSGHATGTEEPDRSK